MSARARNVQSAARAVRFFCCFLLRYSHARAPLPPSLRLACATGFKRARACTLDEDDYASVDGKLARAAAVAVAVVAAAVAAVARRRCLRRRRRH